MRISATRWLRVAQISITRLDFYCNALGLAEVRRRVDEKGAASRWSFWRRRDDTGACVAQSARSGGANAPLVEPDLQIGTARTMARPRLTFGHLAYEESTTIYGDLRAADAGRGHDQTARPPGRRHGLSCDLPTGTPSSCCRRAARRRPRSLGSRCPIPGHLVTRRGALLHRIGWVFAKSSTPSYRPKTERPLPFACRPAQNASIPPRAPRSAHRLAV